MFPDTQIFPTALSSQDIAIYLLPWFRLRLCRQDWNIIPYEYTFFRLTRHLSLPSNTIIGKPFNHSLPPWGILSFVRCRAHIVAEYKPCSFNAPPRIIYLLLRIKKLKPLALFMVFFRFRAKKSKKKGNRSFARTIAFLTFYCKIKCFLADFGYFCFTYGCGC